MLRLLPIILKAIVLMTLLTACSIPRGAALQSEILSKSKTPNPELAVYRVTKAFLPIVANWPATGISGSTGWLSHVHSDHAPIIAVADKITLIIWDNADPSLDSVLKGGDKIIIQRDERFSRSLGAAAKEQLIYFEEDEVTALDAMALIGGIKDNRANSKAILVLHEYPENAVRQNRSGPSNARSVLVLDLTSSDGLFSAGQFAINPNDTVLVTESPITAVNTIFSIIGSVVGISNQLE